MAFQPTKRQRELELVSMILGDRSQLHQQFQELTGFNPNMVFDRDMVRLILSQEYPPEDDSRHPRQPR